MSLVNLAHVCSHLQNASKARLALTSIPCTKLHLRVALQLQKQGFISSVELGGQDPPLPAHMQTVRPLETMLQKEQSRTTKRKPTEQKQDSTDTQTEPANSSHDPSTDFLTAILQKSNTIPSPSTQERAKEKPLYHIPIPPAKRRLWLGLKYWNNLPVISKMGLISKPTKRIWLNSEDIGRVTRGRAAGEVKGMTGVGECVFVSTDRGILEARECAELKVGGMMLCRVV